MTNEDINGAINYLKAYRKMDEKLYNMSPKDSVAYFATNKCLKYWDMAIKALEQTREWIPVSERLPEKSDKYLCTHGGTYLISIDCYNTLEDVKEDDFEDIDNIVGWRSKNVIAWMPLPEPYRTESEEKDADSD